MRSQKPRSRAQQLRHDKSYLWSKAVGTKPRLKKKCPMPECIPPLLNDHWCRGYVKRKQTCSSISMDNHFNESSEALLSHENLTIRFYEVRLIVKVNSSRICLSPLSFTPFIHVCFCWLFTGNRQLWNGSGYIWPLFIGPS